MCSVYGGRGRLFHLRVKGWSGEASTISPAFLKSVSAKRAVAERVH